MGHPDQAQTHRPPGTNRGSATSFRLAGLCVAVFAATLAATALAVDWSDWEHENAIAQKADFLVIRQPGKDFCYLQQSYESDSSKMQLSMKLDRVPFLTLPFIFGIDGDVSYRVDDGPLRLARTKSIIHGLKLSTDVVPELVRGNTLVVRVKPTGTPTVEQHFSLRGFAAALRELDSPKCKENPAAAAAEKAVPTRPAATAAEKAPEKAVPTRPAAKRQWPRDFDVRLRELRDEGIRNLGWIAGNASGYPSWPTIRPYVGRSSKYYSFFLTLAPRGSDHKIEARHNVALYNKWFTMGGARPFDEDDAVLRLRRVRQIVQELGELFDTVR